MARQLGPARKRLLDALGELSDIEEKLAALPGLTETLKRYEEAGLEEKLKEKSLFVREEAVLDAADERIAALAEALEVFEGGLPVDRDIVIADALAELPNAALLAELDAVLEDLSGAAEKQAASIRRALDRALRRVREVRERWDGLSAAAEENYEKTLRELQKTNIDGEEFIRLRRRIERLTPLRDDRQKVKREITTARKDRNALIVAFEEAKAKEFRALERAAKRVSRRLKGRVRVKVKFQGNVEPLLELLRASVGGRLSEACDVLREIDNLSLRALADACRSGTDALVRDFVLPTAQAARIAGAVEETFMAIEELDLPSTTELELNVASPGEPDSWEALEDLSAGQKATAVLLLLLLESDAPLVVDQPEDDLDNRFITGDVVPKMREEKRRRQFVFSTHNANIPVLGDAELIAGLTASGGQAKIPRDQLGSIDVTTVRELVEEVLEGGKDAFELRRLKYGF